MTNEQVLKILNDKKKWCPYHFKEPEYDYWLAKNGYFSLLTLLNAQGGL